MWLCDAFWLTNSKFAIGMISALYTDILLLVITVAYFFVHFVHRDVVFCKRLLNRSAVQELTAYEM